MALYPLLLCLVDSSVLVSFLFLLEHSFSPKQRATSDSSVVSKHPAVSGTVVGIHSITICAMHDYLQTSEINLSENLQNQTAIDFFCLLLPKWRVPNSLRINELSSKR